MKIRHLTTNGKHLTVYVGSSAYFTIKIEKQVEY